MQNAEFLSASYTADVAGQGRKGADRMENIYYLPARLGAEDKML
jgi:hypothetical protein